MRSKHGDWRLNGVFLPVLAVFIVPPTSIAYSQGNSGNAIPGQYIVTLNEGVDVDLASEVMASLTGGNVTNRYRAALRGLSIAVPPVVNIEDIRSFSFVKTAERDLRAYISAQTIPTGIKRIGTLENTVAAINGGGGDVDVDIAIIDTGIDSDHPDLNVAGGRRFYTANSGPPWSRGTYEDDLYDDDNGHGTHVAGTAAAKDNDTGVVGVAPGARLWAVKVLDANGSGSFSDIIAGIDWVTANAEFIEVANMSLGGQGKLDALRTAIQESVAAGVVYIVAAGNDDDDVYGPDGVFNTSDDHIPAAYPEVAAISALADSDGLAGGLGSSTSYGADDSFASFSNYSWNEAAGNPVSSPGKAIDLVLPGVSIYSTYLNGGYATASGTSMASPHAAGLAALYIAANNRAENTAGVYNIRNALIGAGLDQASGQRLASPTSEPDNNPENLGWAGGGVTAPANDPPTADFTYIATNLSVDFTDQSTDSDGSIVSWSWDFGDGGTSTAQNPTHTYGADGTYTVTLTVTDDGGATDSANQDVTVSDGGGGGEPGDPTSVHVGDLDSVSIDNGRTWTPAAAVLVLDNNANPVSGAAVTAVWGGGTVTESTTGIDGLCTLAYPSDLRKNVGSIDCTITDVGYTGLTYDSAANTDPDGDSDGTTITVAKP